MWDHFYCFSSIFFFFNDTATTEIYTLSLHDALPISPITGKPRPDMSIPWATTRPANAVRSRDRKSTRLNFSHRTISYVVFCLKKKSFQVLRDLALHVFMTNRSCGQVVDLP